MPDVPTFREAGHDVVYGGFRMVVAPAGVGPEVLGTLEDACARTAEDPDFVAWASGAAIGASWRGHEGSVAYLEELAPRVERLMAGLEQR